MKFVVIEVHPRGASLTIYEVATEVIAHLLSEPAWYPAAGVFIETPPNPGFAMEYPRGWVFCVNDEAIEKLCDWKAPK